MDTITIQTSMIKEAGFWSGLARKGKKAVIRGRKTIRGIGNKLTEPVDNFADSLYHSWDMPEGAASQLDELDDYAKFMESKGAKLPNDVLIKTVRLSNEPALGVKQVLRNAADVGTAAGNADAAGHYIDNAVQRGWIQLP